VVDDPILGTADRALLVEARRAALATIDPTGRPRLVPICFVVADDAAVLYSPIDDKPKRTHELLELARIRDIAADPRVSILVDRWDEEWSDLAWLRVTGTAQLLPVNDPHHAPAVHALRTKYPQYLEHRIETRPLIAIALERVTRWSAASGPP
jgi:PPOX class probable F420-dependent enzyme